MFKKKVLDNGLTLLFFNDNKKNRSIATVYTYVGGVDNHFVYDGIEYNQVRGIAHFLEHYLIEKSRYGNVLEQFSNDYIDTNGITTFNKTFYYISTVHDFTENYIKLLNVVNNPNFDENSINDVKKPILAEINQSLDHPSYGFNKYVDGCIHKVPRCNINLGEPEDITNMTIDDIKIFHEAFYQPSNQVIVISGKFDEDEIIKITEKEYESFKRDYKPVVRDEINESVEVISKTGEFVDPTKQNMFEAIYKIDISSLTPIEKYKYDFYLGFMLLNSFSEKSESYKEIREKGLSMFTISTRYVFDNKNILEIYLYGSSDRLDELFEVAHKHLVNNSLTEENFKEILNRKLLEVTNRNESIFNISEYAMDNYFLFDYEESDEIDVLKKFNYQECMEMLNKLDFSNYSYIKRIKGE